MSWTLFWYWPGAMGYHLIYMMQLMESNFVVSLSGPRYCSKNRVRTEFPKLHELHNSYGAVMSEAQMTDSCMCLNSLFMAAIEDYIPGQKDATLANYVKMVELV
jgi:hypothetical protein